MTETVTFRSSLGGFNRNEVIAYVGKMIEDNRAMQEKIAELEKAAAEKDAQIRRKDEMLAALQKRVSELESTRSDVAKIGETMFDARRFSDLIIGEANESAEEMFAAAAASAASTSESATALVNDMETLKSALKSRIEEMIREMTDLKASLASFDDDVAGVRAQFRAKYAKAAEDIDAGPAAQLNAAAVNAAAESKPAADPDPMRRKAAVKVRPGAPRVRVKPSDNRHA